MSLAHSHQHTIPLHTSASAFAFPTLFSVFMKNMFCTSWGTHTARTVFRDAPRCHIFPACICSSPGPIESWRKRPPVEHRSHEPHHCFDYVIIEKINKNATVGIYKTNYDVFNCFRDSKPFPFTRTCFWWRSYSRNYIMKLISMLSVPNIPETFQAQHDQKYDTNRKNWSHEQDTKGT